MSVSVWDRHLRRCCVPEIEKRMHHGFGFHTLGVYDKVYGNDSQGHYCHYDSFCGCKPAKDQKTVSTFHK